MVKTRGRKHSALRSYRRRVRASKCRGAGPAVCRGRVGCKYASGRKRSFCRKSRNTRRRRRTHRRRSSKGGGHRRRHRTKHRRRRRRRKTGGSIGLAAALRKLVVPGILTGLARRHRHRRHRRKSKRSRKSRRSRSR